VPVRLTDTAGLRDIHDEIEQIGVERAHRLVGRADVLLWLGEPEVAPAHTRLLLVHAKCDLPARSRVPYDSIPVSSNTGEGLAELMEAVGRAASELVPVEGQLALNKRQASCIKEAGEALTHAAESDDPVLRAESLRLARMAFDRLTGRAGVEDMLEALFGRFCLGK